MLLTVRNMKDLPFSQLMLVYEETNRETGSRFWRSEPEPRRWALAEEEFYTYLSDSFFRTPGAVYDLWQEQGRVVSALRREPYADGIVLAALETAPDARGKGYASKLLTQVLLDCAHQRVYVHIHRNNTVSRKLHLHCGFELLRHGATLLDGSYRGDYDTFIYKTLI